jgi:phasin family protein
MIMTNEQLVAAHKANVETLFGLTSKAFENIQKLTELNLNASREALQQSAEHTQALLSAKDAQELLALQARLFQPLAEKTVAFSRQLIDIAATRDFSEALETKNALHAAIAAFASIQKALKQAADLQATDWAAGP